MSWQALLRGLRYPVETVLEWLASGMTTEEILKDYEDMEREDILAVLAYAAHLEGSEPSLFPVIGKLGEAFPDDIADDDLGADVPRHNLN